MFTLWFMGRPAAGKSTLARRVKARLSEAGYSIENLDGDDLREQFHPNLGFSREDRRINNRRTAYIAKLLNRNGVPVAVGMITPFRKSQSQARDIVEDAGGDFVLIYVKCSVETAKKRDPKNLYQQAKAGNIDNFTGINHPFQKPRHPDIVVDTETQSVAESVDDILRQLQSIGVLDEGATELGG
ncbi:MAG: adenylyl-sulfate kinase [Haloplanus sp.]